MCATHSLSSIAPCNRVCLHSNPEVDRTQNNPRVDLIQNIDEYRIYRIIQEIEGSLHDIALFPECLHTSDVAHRQSHENVFSAEI